MMLTKNLFPMLIVVLAALSPRPAIGIDKDSTVETKIEVTTSSLEQLSEVLKTTADSLTTFHKQKFVRINPKLIPKDDVFSDTLDNIKHIYDFHRAIELDIARSDNRNFTVLSSHTLEQASRFGLSVMPKVVEHLYETGKVRNVFKTKLTLATLGVEDLVTAGARHIGSGHADIETVTLYLDSANKAAWGILGYVASGGNVKIASTFQSIGGTAAKLGRTFTAGFIQKAYIKLQQVDVALIRTHREAQNVRLANNLKPQTIEEFFQFDNSILSKLNSTQIREANNQYGLRSAKQAVVMRTPPIIRRTNESYREICRSGFCTRSPITSRSTFQAYQNDDSRRVGRDAVFSNKMMDQKRYPQVQNYWKGTSAFYRAKNSLEKYPTAQHTISESKSTRIDPEVLQKTSPLMGTSVHASSVPIPRMNTISSNDRSLRSFRPVGGVSTKELANTFVNKGNWPVITTFSLNYSPDPYYEE